MQKRTDVKKPQQAEPDEATGEIGLDGTENEANRGLAGIYEDNKVLKLVQTAGFDNPNTAH